MPSLGYPILLSQSFDGAYTARLVESDEDLAAVGDTAARAAEQIKDYLNWKRRTEPWMPEPDFLEPRFTFVKVEVRPEYVVEERTFPAEHCITVRVACVSGKDSAGLLLCTLPTLGLRFTYYEPGSLKELVIYGVQNALKGLTPQQLSRHLPPPVIALDEVVIFAPKRDVEREREQERQAKLAVLPTAADPIGAREFRARFSRPWERDAQAKRLVGMLRDERASVLLVGETGSGKTAILAEAVRSIERELPPAPTAEAPPGREVVPHDRRFWMVSGSRLIAGMKYLGMWQERCEQLIAELSTIDGVLCLENLLDLVKTGGQGPLDSIAAFLIPYLQRRELRVVAEVTPAELDACRRLLPGLTELIQILPVDLMTREQALAALGHVADAQKQNLHVDVDRGVVELVYRLFARFLPYQSFPGRAASFLAALFDHAARQRAALTFKLVIDRFVRQSGLPELLLRDDLPLEHAAVVRTLQASVIGQDAACAAAAAVITTLKAGLNDPQRPVGVLLFCGPTGVGKTELARAASRFLFGHGDQKDRLLRLDMSEYAGPGAATRLLADPAGNPSDFIQRIRQQPFSVLLLDEIEKAAPEIFDVLLSVFDEGRLTDRYGRLTSFRSALIVMTSNLGVNTAEPFGFNRPQAAAYDSAAMGFFRPEFFNRIDSIVTFAPLSDQTIRQITVKELNDLAQREGLAKANLKLTWSDALVAALAAAGFDPRYGARPLQRTLETRLVTPLAKFLVKHPKLRALCIHLDLDEHGDLTFST
ncbi:MAG: ATP-dependent Clp protease ATP-binding subunit ClpC [Sphingomonadales bacterium]|jgi:ATP-dependent Clp protease ATP-binding subunit ClpC|nr:ATP-dependent Clp protease ATP-binding subunit ClpC [Sphingomonadales bacterium]